MVVVLKFLSTFLLVVGLVICAIFIGYETIEWRQNQDWPPKRLEILYFSASCVAVAMVTLGLLEIRDSIPRSGQQSAASSEPLQNPPQQPTSKDPMSNRPDDPKRHKIDVRTSYLDIQDR